MKQQILSEENQYAELDVYLKKQKISRMLLVCGNSISGLKLNSYLHSLKNRMGIEVIRFSEFHTNPCYESVEKGMEVYRKSKCDCIMAVGGGSAMDVAKCIKLYVNMHPDSFYLKEKVVPNNIPFIAIPTTAGSGSEVTRFAVIYYQGEKQSVADVSCIPAVVVLDSSVLESLPLYQKKVTMMDALCHALESFWSVNSTNESKDFSKKAIRLILDNKDLYLLNDEEGNLNMLYAANLAGKAINITQTTAGHAMSYKLTSLYQIAHGHAVALCVVRLWEYMLEHIEQCVDSRGREYLKNVFEEIAQAMGCETSWRAVELFKEFVDSLELKIPIPRGEEDLKILTKSVNQDRFKNNPIMLEDKIIERLYRIILQID